MSKRLLGALKIVCGKTGAEEDLYEDDVEDERVLYDASESRSPDRPFYWSAALQRSFREELEKYDTLLHHTLRPCSCSCPWLTTRIPAV